MLFNRVLNRRSAGGNKSLVLRSVLEPGNKVLRIGLRGVDIGQSEVAGYDWAQTEDGSNFWFVTQKKESMIFSWTP